MQARMKNPAHVIPDAFGAIQGLIKVATQTKAVPHATLELVHLRASQINGCAPCIDYGVKQMRKAGETEERLACVVAWREAPWFSEPERAALALAEEVTRLADRPNPVPDDVWNEAKRHYSEEGLAALLLWISVTNVFNRMNVATRQIPGSAW